MGRNLGLMGSVYRLLGACLYAWIDELRQSVFRRAASSVVFRIFPQGKPKYGCSAVMYMWEVVVVAGLQRRIHTHVFMSLN